MKKYRKLIIVVSILLVLGIVAFLWLPPSQERIEKIFFRDKDELSVVCEYLLTVDCEASIEYDGVDCYIEKYEPIPSTNKLNVVKEKISDVAVTEAAEYLLSKKEYYKIFKSDNTIIFTKWHRGPDWSGGVAYKINKSGDLDIPAVAKLAELSGDGWYYYESKW